MMEMRNMVHQGISFSGCMCMHLQFGVMYARTVHAFTLPNIVAYTVEYDNIDGMKLMLISTIHRVTQCTWKTGENKDKW